MKKSLVIVALLLAFGAQAQTPNTTLTGVILSPAGSPISGNLFLQLSQAANVLSSGGCGGPAIVATSPPFIFSLTTGSVPVGSKVWGSDCLSPAGLTYHLTATDRGGQTILERDVSISGTTVDLSVLSPVTPAPVVPSQLAGDVTGPASTTRVVALRGVSLTTTVPTSGQVLGFNGTAWSPTSTPILPGFVRADGTVPLTASWPAGNFAITSKNSTGWVNVSAAATGGTGSSGSPWTGWDTAITWAANTEYVFPCGTYSYATSPNFALAGIRLRGEGPCTILKYTGAAEAVKFDAGATPAVITDVAMEGFFLTGNTNCTAGLYLSGIHGSMFKDIGIFTGGTAALYSKFSVVNTFDNVQVNSNITAYSPTPAIGVLLDTRTGAAESSNSNTFRDLTVVNCSGSGIKLVAAINNTFIGGTSATNNRGIEIVTWAGGTPESNTFIGMDIEANTVEDLLVSGRNNNFYSMKVAGTTHLTNAASSMNQFVGGDYHAITLDAGVDSNSFVNIAYSGAGAFTDNGTSTTKLNVYNRTTPGFDANYVSGTFGVGGPPTSPLYVKESNAAADHDVARLQNVGNWGANKMTSFSWLDSTQAVAGLGAIFVGGTGTTDIRFHSLYNSGYKASTDVVMTVSGNGNVGVGTTAPKTLLQIGGATTALNSPIQYSSGTTPLAVPGVLFTQTADKVTTANAATTLFSTGVGTLTLPANLLVAGRTIRITMGGYVSVATATGTHTLLLSLGGVTVATGTSPAVLTSVVNTGWQATATITCRTTGAGGTVIGGAEFRTGATAAVAESAVFASNTTTAAADTTATLAIDLTLNNGAAAGTYTTQTAVVEILN